MATGSLTWQDLARNGLMEDLELLDKQARELGIFWLTLPREKEDAQMMIRALTRVTVNQAWPETKSNQAALVKQKAMTLLFVIGKSY